jgi:putative ATPase
VRAQSDAALYWLARKLTAAPTGYLARRLTRRRLRTSVLQTRARAAIEAWKAYDRLGSPEGELACALTLTWPAPRRTRLAFNAARDVEAHGTQDVPLHFRNAPTKLMKSLGHGKDYQYDHDAEGGIALDQTGFPDAMGERVYYQPVARGMELKLKEKLDSLRAAREQARKGKP